MVSKGCQSQTSARLCCLQQALGCLLLLPLPGLQKDLQSTCSKGVLLITEQHDWHVTYVWFGKSYAHRPARSLLHKANSNAILNPNGYNNVRHKFAKFDQNGCYALRCELCMATRVSI